MGNKEVSADSSGDQMQSLRALSVLVPLVGRVLKLVADRVESRRGPNPVSNGLRSVSSIAAKPTKSEKKQVRKAVTS